MLASAAAISVTLPATSSLAAQRPELFRRYYDATDELHSAIHQVIGFRLQHGIAFRRVRQLETLQSRDRLQQRSAMLHA